MCIKIWRNENEIIKSWTDAKPAEKKEEKKLINIIITSLKERDVEKNAVEKKKNETPVNVYINIYMHIIYYKPSLGCQLAFRPIPVCRSRAHPPCM